ncbi:MAG: tRNA (guanosine(37)-N1)-methyltransferase TrmD [Oligoflexia bacterium]|nr:tRNA (guanosine(37)-N1)-methyltransferase TrmD [Oligoflexia bacterium]
MKKIWILTLFPEFFEPLKEAGVVGQALSGKRGHDYELITIQLRDFHPQGHQGVDDTPYGGGAGMVMRADALKDAFEKGIIEAGKYGANWKEQLHVIAPGPRGKVWNFEMAQTFAKEKFIEGKKDLVFVCGRYEGIDERFIENYVDEHYSLGDFILSGGELAVMTFIDSAMRFVPNVLKNYESVLEESFGSELLEYPQYTRPAEFEGMSVPEILTSGHHKKIAEYRLEKRKEMTKKFRPDLWAKYSEKK